MLHSNVEMSKSYGGILDIALSFVAFCILFWVPVISISVTGQTASQTILPLLEKTGETSYVFGLLFPFILMAVVGMLKLAFRKVFPRFVLEVVSLYATVSCFIGFIVATPMIAKLTTNTSFSLLGYSAGVSTGMCFPFLIFLSFGWLVFTILHYCSFYRWYPLQTLFWALHPIVCPLASLLCNLLVSLVIGLISTDALVDSMLTVSVIVNFLVLFVEIGIVMAYRKTWNSKLRANWARKHPEETAGMEGTSVASEPQAAVPEQPAPVSPQPVVRKEEVNKTETSATDNIESAPALRPQRNVRLCVGFGVGVVAAALVVFFLSRGEEKKDAPVNIPAICETVYEGKVGKAAVQMTLAQNGDTLTGSYFYTKHKQPIELKGAVEGVNYVLKEYVDRKNTGTFTLFPGEYDGEEFLEGEWKDGNRSVHVNLSAKVSRIRPSADANHPFVGEWETADGEEKMCMLRLGLYNKDINGEYVWGTIFADDCIYQLSVDSVLSVAGNDATLLMSFGTDSQQFKLHYSPSDRSLLVETEKWGTYHLQLADLAARLEYSKRVLESIPQAPSIEDVEIQNIAEYESVKVVSSPVEPVQEVEIESGVNEDEEAEKARLKAELEAELQKEQPEEEVVDIDKVYDVVEEMPEYPGGMSAMMNFIGQNLEYPSISQESGVQGRVLVQFVVDVDGSITDVKVARSVDPYLDKEAVRVINAMPKWKPGKQKGKPVKVKYTVPITFKLG